MTIRASLSSLIVSNYILFATCAKILCIYPSPLYSHHKVFGVLTEELAKRGHQLIVLTPLPAGKYIENVTEIDVQNISTSMWETGLIKFMENHNGVTVDPTTFLNFYTRVIDSVLEAQLSHPDMKELIRDQTQQFDLILAEACVRPAFTIAARFKTPVILVSSTCGLSHNFHAIGAPHNPVFYRDITPHAGDHSLWSKISLLYEDVKHRRYLGDQDINGLIRRQFGENAPTIKELDKYVKGLFINLHHTWDSNRPAPPSLVYMGALHLKKPKEIESNDIKEYLDRSINGVIYMSLGTNYKSSDLPPETLRVIVKVFTSLPYDVLWKWDGGDINGKSENIRLEKWVQQSDMLFHPSVKAFITHGGLQSTDEAIAAEVPLVGLPICADQFMNADKYVQNGIGIRLDIENLNEVEFKRAILKVAEDKSYRANIARLSRIMKQQRARSLHKAVRWVEHIAAHGSTLNLISPLADASYADYFMLDIFVPLALALALAICIMIGSIRFIRKRLIILKKIT